MYASGLFPVDGIRLSRVFHFADIDDSVPSVEKEVNLGIYYRDGRYVKHNDKKAFEWFMRAAERGYSQGQFLVAKCYADGTGVRKSDKKALEWYTKAAEQGDKDAMLEVGGFYCHGRGVKRDDKNSLSAQCA